MEVIEVAMYGYTILKPRVHVWTSLVIMQIINKTKTRQTNYLMLVLSVKNNNNKSIYLPSARLSVYHLNNKPFNLIYQLSYFGFALSGREVIE